MSDIWGKISSQYKRMSAALIEIILRASQSFAENRANEAAASISYYALFSLFPLILFIITIGSYILEASIIQQLLFDWAGQVFPTAQDLVVRNVKSVLSLRGTFGIVALISLLWSATSVFYMLILNINRAFPDADLHTFIKGRLFALMMVGGLTVLLLVSLSFNTLVDVLSHFQDAIVGFEKFETIFWQILTITIPFLLKFFIFFSLYSWVPNTKVDILASFWGALAAVLALQITTSAFAWFIQSGLVHYELIYGSLGTIITLMLWIYLTATITLFGAHLSAAIARFKLFIRMRK